MALIRQDGTVHFPFAPKGSTQQKAPAAAAQQQAPDALCTALASWAGADRLPASYKKVHSSARF